MLEADELLVPTTCLKKLTSTYGSMSAVLSPTNAFVTLAMMLELLRGRPSARYTFMQKRAQGRSDGNPSGSSRFLRQRSMEALKQVSPSNQKLEIPPFHHIFEEPLKQKAKKKKGL